MFCKKSVSSLQMLAPNQISMSPQVKQPLLIKHEICQKSYMTQFFGLVLAVTHLLLKSRNLSSTEKN